MPTSIKTLAGILLVASLAGCTNKVEIPAFAGPSTLAYSILLTSNATSLIQDGVSSATIEITGRDSNGQPITGRPLRAAIIVGGVVQDYGTLSTKSPVTGGTLRYTSPPASPIAGGQVATTVTIAVTPIDSSDFLNELTRGVDIQLVPQGVILPTNPALVAAFTVTPASPQAFSTAAFDASTTTNNGTACLTACSYAWNFGDGTSGSGMVTSHEFRTVGAVQVSLTVTDSRGAQNTSVRTVTVAASTPPVASFLMSPTPAAVDNDVFFNAEQSRATLPRRIVSYGWNFGDGRTGSGVTVSHRFSSVGTYSVVLTVTDDANAVGQATQTLSVAAGAPTPEFDISPSTNATTATDINFDAARSRPGASPIAKYGFNWGDGTTTNLLAPDSRTSHRYSAPGTYTVRLTVEDTQGRTASIVKTVTVS